jgi:hypothetical protein
MISDSGIFTDIIKQLDVQYRGIAQAAFNLKRRKCTVCTKSIGDCLLY